MSSRELSFAPDRRTVNNNFYHFNYQSSGYVNRRGFTREDSLRAELSEIYEHKFPDISKELRILLAQIIVDQKVPLDHYNLNFLVVANFIVYQMRAHQEELTPQSFDKYFNAIFERIMPNTEKKSQEEIKIIQVQHKLSMFRYVKYIIDHTYNFLQPTPKFVIET